MDLYLLSLALGALMLTLLLISRNKDVKTFVRSYTYDFWYIVSRILKKKFKLLIIYRLGTGPTNTPH
jgi:hypothetical protein